MPWKPDWSAFDHDASLDMFRDTVAQVSDDQVTGFVVFRVEAMFTRTGGRLWWSRWARGREWVEWIEAFWLDSRDAPDPEKAIMSDGITGPDSAWLDDISNGSYRLHPPPASEDVAEERILTVRWLSGEELEAAKREWGWGVTWT